MASADFSQFVVTTAHETACETSPVKVRSLSLHAPAASTRTSDNFWTSVSFATLSAFPSLICGSCSSGQRFAYSFFQIPPHDGHPCCSAMYFVVVYAHSGLSPVRERPCRANKRDKQSLYSAYLSLWQCCYAEMSVLSVPLVFFMLTFSAIPSASALNRINLCIHCGLFSISLYNLWTVLFPTRRSITANR